jgi:hypothetical protein
MAPGRPRAVSRPRFAGGALGYLATLRAGVLSNHAATDGGGGAAVAAATAVPFGTYLRSESLPPFLSVTVASLSAQGSPLQSFRVSCFFDSKFEKRPHLEHPLPPEPMQALPSQRKVQYPAAVPCRSVPLSALMHAERASWMLELELGRLVRRIIPRNPKKLHATGPATSAGSRLGWRAATGVGLRQLHHADAWYVKLPA